MEAPSDRCRLSRPCCRRASPTLSPPLVYLPASACPLLAADRQPTDSSPPSSSSSSSSPPTTACRPTAAHRPAAESTLCCLWSLRVTLSVTRVRCGLFVLLYTVIGIHGFVFDQCSCSCERYSLCMHTHAHKRTRARAGAHACTHARREPERAPHRTAHARAEHKHVFDILRVGGGGARPPVVILMLC